VDELGYVEDAVAALAAQLQLKSFDVFEYRSTPGLIDALLGSRASATDPLAEILQAGIPKAMYYASWNPWVPSNAR
jgi:hypothetical protein